MWWAKSMRNESQIGRKEKKQVREKQKRSREGRKQRQDVALKGDWKCA